MSGEWSGRVGRTPFKDEILYPSSGTDGCLTRFKTAHLASGYTNVEW